MEKEEEEEEEEEEQEEEEAPWLKISLGSSGWQRKERKKKKPDQKRKWLKSGRMDLIRHLLELRFLVKVRRWLL